MCITTTVHYWRAGDLSTTCKASSLLTELRPLLCQLLQTEGSKKGRIKVQLDRLILFNFHFGDFIFLSVRPICPLNEHWKLIPIMILVRWALWGDETKAETLLSGYKMWDRFTLDSLLFFCILSAWRYLDRAILRTVRNKISVVYKSPCVFCYSPS